MLCGITSCTRLQIQWGNCNFNLRILGIVNLLARWGPLGGGIERRYVCVRAPLNIFPDWKGLRGNARMLESSTMQ